ncbi:thrombospondin type-1 domain-containing protein 1 [Pristis pectinata]|uniref:thrombospondin type-1 domain-containing protein 1 n=1 Tax=Pristis pectinata TaxID=685728 RepID=UPI00223CAF7E|nr:thrombospondin type-1 domain-containing protein 1 [Pristis pectinata]
MKSPRRRSPAGFTRVLVLVLCGCAVFAEVSYRLSGQPWHVALSNQTVHVDFKVLNKTSAQNLTLSLVDVKRNQTVATKLIPGNQSQGSVEFECFHFPYAGNFEFRLIDFTDNDTARWTSDLLQVRWPVFAIEARSESDSSSHFQVHVFTLEYLCSWKVITLFLDTVVIDFNGPGAYNINKALKPTISKEIELSSSQRLDFDCTGFNQNTSLKISLRSPYTNSVIASTGPLVFAQIVGYKLLVDHLKTAACDSAAEVRIVVPPCARLRGKITVYKNQTGASFGRETFVAEKWLRPGENTTEFNCSVFDFGKHNYCFEYVSILNHSPVKCVTLQRHAERGSVWMSWSPCSVTCGDGVRERYRQCVSSFSGTIGCSGEEREVSLCSLVDCTEQESGAPGKAHKTGNIVTITGISFCLVIIIATIAITIRTKLPCKEQNLNSTVRHDPAPPHNFRNTFEEERNFSDPSHQRDILTDNMPLAHVEDGLSIPLSFRRSQHFVLNQDTLPEENLGLQSAQKVIPPIFGYRLAHQQLKEMKKKGITEATQVYHVTQHPLDDTIMNEGGALATEIDQAKSSSVVVPSLDKENSAESNMNRFRIKSPFLDQNSIYCKQHRKDPMIAPFPEPFNDFNLPCQIPVSLCEGNNKTLPNRPGKFRHCDKITEREMLERGYIRNPNFRRTSSFSECRTSKYYRERSMSSCTQKLPSLSHSRGIDKTVAGSERCINNKPGAQYRTNASSARNHAWDCSAFISEPSKHHLRSSQAGVWTNKADPANDHPITSCVFSELETYTGKRKARTPTNENKLAAKASDPNSEKHSQWKYPRSNPLPRHHYRQDRCQSFPSDPNFLHYDNSGFELTASEQQIIDLPAHFGSHVIGDEEDTSTLSSEKLVI